MKPCLTLIAAARMACIAISLVPMASWSAPEIALPTAHIRTLNYDLKASALPGGWYVIAGSNDDFNPTNGCNIINTGFIVDDQGVVVINTGVSLLYGEQQAALIQKTTNKPVREVWSLNLHPDYFFGHQAFPKASLQATEKTITGMQLEGKAYADNLYRLCGDWMKGTESTPPSVVLHPAEKKLTNQSIQLLELKGHTDSDLVVFDRTNGVLWAGGLVFNQRVPTMPHANIQPWVESLKTLQTLPVNILIPSHGPVSQGKQAISDTIDYLTWFEDRLKTSAQKGLELNEVLRLPIPDRFRHWAAMPIEYARNVTSLYPRYEDQSFK